MHKLKILMRSQLRKKKTKAKRKTKHEIPQKDIKRTRKDLSSLRKKFLIAWSRDQINWFCDALHPALAFATEMKYGWKHVQKAFHFLLCESEKRPEREPEAADPLSQQGVQQTFASLVFLSLFQIWQIMPTLANKSLAPLSLSSYVNYCCPLRAIVGGLLPS